MHTCAKYYRCIGGMIFSKYSVFKRGNNKVLSGEVMKRVKWDLDQLKGVQKQQEIAMTSTEQVINKARNDLNSMTEEVWEGEDGDMARELLGDLVYKEMPQTWKEIDAINTAIKKAQKTANESKNFCNEFSQIFKDGSLPSETDSAECSGELLCDTGSCDLLKAAMGAAGKNAVNVKRNIETVENILSELETPEAKFDYTSYTGPIKEQAQNVADRTMMFNNAVSRYESKVREMDDTLATELMEAIPSAVPVPFDPFCLHNGKTIKMGGGDIVEFIEALKAIELGGKFGIKEIQAILKILFGKEKVDISDLTETELVMAFIKLTKEQQKAILLEMGLTAAQIAAILAAGLPSGLAIPKAILGKKLAKTIIEAIKKYLKEHDQGDDQADNSGTEEETADEDIENIDNSYEETLTPGDPIYKRGDSGEEIRQIQQWLKDNGYYTAGKVDADYGGGMELAIARYQRQHGLPVTGYIDQNTLDSLNETMEIGGIDQYQPFVVDMDYIRENYDLTEDQYKTLERIYNDTSLGLSTEKKNSMLVIAAELYAKGMNDSFVAGVLANVEAEGSAGQFQKCSKACRRKIGEKQYEYYDPEGINYSRDYSGGNIQAIGLQKALELAEKVESNANYGMGSAQWTYPSRRNALLEAYKEALGYPDDGNPTQEQNYPTEEQCIRIEAAFEAGELDSWTCTIKNKTYDLTDYWEGQIEDLDSKEAAILAAQDVCKYYEIPEDTETQASTRGDRAGEIYDVLKGE